MKKQTARYFIIVALTLSIIVSTASSAQQLFDSRRDFLTYGNRSVITADVTNDGIPDLVTAESGLSVLVGRGDGTFLNAVDHDPGRSPISVDAADLNSDGIMDLVTANSIYGGQDVSVLVGSVPGEFHPPVRYDLGSGRGPQRVAIGDLNQDDVPDLITTNGSSDDIAVLLGNGDGTFQAAVNHDVPGGPNDLILHDLDGDDILDVAISLGTGEALLVGSGNGDGTFERIGYYQMGSRAQEMAIGDLNADNIPDLAVLSSGRAVSVLLGTGNGNFHTPVHYVGYPESDSVTIGDLNDDGYDDVIVNVYGSAMVYLANSDGTLQERITYPIGSRGVSAITGDLNLDGKLDLVTGSSEGFSVSVLLGQGDGTFPTPPIYDAGGIDSTAIDISDLNNDGLSDLAVVNHDEDKVSIHLGQGVGIFHPAGILDTGNGPNAITIGDLNHDDHPDLLVSNEISDDVSVFMGNGDGTFSVATSFPAGANTRALAIGNLNNDGDPDLVITDSSSDSVSLLPGNGDGTFGPALSYTVGYDPSCVVIGDLNNDGNQDLVTNDAYFDREHIWVLLGNGDGSCQSPASIYVGDQPSALAMNDLDGDGNQDLAIGYYPFSTRAPVITVLRGDGNGTFLPGIACRVGGKTSSIYIDDLDADGFDDIIATSWVSNSVSVLPGNGDGSFQAATIHGTGSSQKDTALGDLDGNSVPDLVVNRGDSTLTMLINRSAPTAGMVSASLACSPSSGTLPFPSLLQVSMASAYIGQARRLQYTIDVTLAGGQFYSSWRRGWQNILPGESYTRQWTQTIPQWPNLVGVNLFEMTVADVTPPPYNLPPYPPAGDTDTDSCAVTGVAP